MDLPDYAVKQGRSVLFCRCNGTRRNTSMGKRSKEASSSSRFIGPSRLSASYALKQVRTSSAAFANRATLSRRPGLTSNRLGQLTRL